MNCKKRAAGIKVFGLDVDGVLTDGTFISVDGKNRRGFHMRDGLGLLLLRLAGVKTVIITGKKADRALLERAEELKISAVYDDCSDKVRAMDEFLKRRHTAWEETSYMGDDLPDLPLLRKVGLAFAPADAVAEIRETVQIVCAQPGGRGAVREAAEYILKESGRWTDALKKYSSH